MAKKVQVRTSIMAENTFVSCFTWRCEECDDGGEEGSIGEASRVGHAHFKEAHRSNNLAEQETEPFPEVVSG